MNDAAVQALGLLTVPQAAHPPGGLAPDLEAVAARGITRRGDVLVWADSVGNAEGAPSIFRDLTGWECSDSSFHLEDCVPVPVAVVDDAPVIAEEDQRTLLRHGLAFALMFSRLVYDLEQPSAVRCIIGVNDTNGTFRFHQIRNGESWHYPDLERYRDKMIVVDIKPSSPGPLPE
ncbi:hypothetical protein HC028_19880 [Planosporangium flavigriseum]|nr:hypothetical protein [Planosporangium flavigriseum]